MKRARGKGVEGGDGRGDAGEAPGFSPRKKTPGARWGPWRDAGPAGGPARGGRCGAGGGARGTGGFGQNGRKDFRRPGEKFFEHLVTG